MIYALLFTVMYHNLQTKMIGKVDDRLCLLYVTLHYQHCTNIKKYDSLSKGTLIHMLVTRLETNIQPLKL